MEEEHLKVLRERCKDPAWRPSTSDLHRVLEHCETLPTSQMVKEADAMNIEIENLGNKVDALNKEIKTLKEKNTELYGILEEQNIKTFTDRGGRLRVLKKTVKSEKSRQSKK